MAADSLFCRIYGIIGTSEKKGGFRMPQSEMEALIQLQKETIESLRQLVDSQLYITVKMYPCSGGTDTGSPEL